MKLAATLNNCLAPLSGGRGTKSIKIPAARVAPTKEVIELFPEVNQDGLRGGLVWFDGVMMDWARVIESVANRARQLGVQIFEGVSATELRISENRVEGLVGQRQPDNQVVEFRTGCVVNAAGPWCRAVSKKFDRELSGLFHPVLAFNLLLDRPPLSSAGLALSPNRDVGRACFLTSENDRILAGTYYRAETASLTKATASNADIQDFLDDLNQCVPSLALAPRDVLRVDAGWVPGKAAGSEALRTSPEIVDHSRHGGPYGLISVSGVKFTTARAVAHRTLKLISRSIGKNDAISKSRPIIAGESTTEKPTKVSPANQQNF